MQIAGLLRLIFFRAAFGIQQLLDMSTLDQFETRYLA